MRGRAAVLVLIVAGLLAVTMAGCSRDGESMEWQAQARATNATAAAVAVTAPAALPDFSVLVATYGPAVVTLVVGEAVRASDPASGRGFIVFSEGSGFIVSPDGVILTSAHLVDRADAVIVTLSDRREFKTTVLGQDKESDVAVIKVDAQDLPTVRLGDSSSVRPGEWVVAIGSPFGFENTVTSGIVSARDRFLPSQPYVPFIQTDVPVNPGNSGSPLFNMNGEVVGINVAIYSATPGFMGLSFAVPIDLAVKVKDQLLRGGRVRRGNLGVVTGDLPQPLADSVGLPKRQGALVIAVEEDGPAAEAGLKPGDSISGGTVEEETLPRSSASSNVADPGRKDRDCDRPATEIGNGPTCGASSTSIARSGTGTCNGANEPSRNDQVSWSSAQLIATRQPYNHGRGGN